MSGKRILLLDEDTARRKLNAFGLRCAGFNVDEAADAAAARSCIARHYPHSVLIGAGLLDFAIQDFVRAIRGSAHTRDLPILILVERQSELGAATALEWGIDDYIVEPISPEGFVARVRASLAPSSRVALAAGDIANLSLDSESGIVRRGNRSITLGPTERRLLENFLRHPDQIIPRDLLLFRIWGAEANLRSRVLDVSVCRLRQALRHLGCAELLHTVSRRGYTFLSHRLESRVATRDSSNHSRSQI